MDNIKAIRAKRPDWAALPDDVLVDVVRQRYYPELSNEQLAKEIGVEVTPVATKSRTWGQIAKDTAADTGRAVASGVGSLIKGGGTAYGLATGNMDNVATELGDSVSRYWEDGQSTQLKEKKAARSQAIDDADGILGKAGTAFIETVSDPALAVDAVASNIAGIIPGAVVGRLAAGASAARGLAAASKFGPASAAAREAVGKAAGTLGTRAAIGTGALQQGADVSGDVYESVMKKPDAVWANNPEFMSVFGETDGSERAWQDTKKAFALKTARTAMPAATAISLAANALPGADMLERALVGGAARQTLKDGVKYALPKSIVKGALGETAQETIEEGGGAFAGNVAKQQFVDSRQDLSENVGENAGMGAAGGFLMGGAAGAFQGKAAGTATNPTLAAKQAAADQAALAKANAITAARNAAQTPNSPLSRATAAAHPLGAAPTLTPEQIEAEIARLEAEAEIETDSAPALATQTPAAIDSGASSGPVTGPADAVPATAPPMQPEPDLATMGVLDGDKLNGVGMPFSFEKAAQFALRKHPGHELTKLDSGWVIRPTPVDVSKNSENLDTSPKPVQKTPESVQMPGTTQEVPAYADQAEAVANTAPATPDTGPAKADAPAQLPTADSAVPAPAAELTDQPDALNAQNTPAPATQTQASADQTPKAGAPDAPGTTAAGAQAGTGDLEAAGVSDANQRLDAKLGSRPATQQPGQIGAKYSQGDTPGTSSGRLTSPFPKVQTDTNRKAGTTVKLVNAWLIQNALDEANSRGDEFNARQFEADLKNLQTADKDSAEEYLFGENQAAVPRPFTRPLMPVVAAPASATAGLAPVSEQNKPVAQSKPASKAIDSVAPPPLETSDTAPVKWFGTKDKAAGYLIKNKLIKTHQIVDAGASRFEVREKSANLPVEINSTSRQEKIDTILSQGGKVVDGTLRTSNGMSLYALTADDMASVAADKQDTSAAITARLQGVYGVSAQANAPEVVADQPVAQASSTGTNGTAAEPDNTRTAEMVELRKRVSVLKSIRKCMAA